MNANSTPTRICNHHKAAIHVGFYYMANAGGRLTGAALSGWLVNTTGLQVVDVYGTEIAFLSHTG